tara:strand:- start:49 stop:615 length:567 start_codon:yes stop_codon:yes gene_type:complete
MKQIVGIDTRSQSSIQEELSRLGLKEFELYKNSTVKNPVIRYVVEERLSKSLNKEFLRWRSQPRTELSGASYDDLDVNAQRQLFEDFISKQVQDTVKDTAERWGEYSKFAPTSAAGYIRNMYMIQGKTDIMGKPRYDAAAQSIPNSQYQTAEDYLVESTSLIDELNRRQMLMYYADIAEDSFKKIVDN